ncbi:hypothetical protein PAPHI01_1373 [Pancytospora philotis]|nr:hypothetical protein PAPHI01_1373 [Pancytospora philotis]
MDNRAYRIGINNRHAPNLYRMYNCYDHLFPYELKRMGDEFGNERLVAGLETFWSLVSHKLNLKMPQMTSTGRMEFYHKMLRQDKTLYRMLSSGPEAREVSVTLGPEEKQVYLCRNYLTELSEAIAELRDISVFQTCCNYLRYIPSSIGQLQNLKMLILSRNRLIELPSEIGLCRELRELDVSFNALRLLPRSIAGLRNLNTLHISGNHFAEIPSFIGKLSALKYLSIGYNPIRSVPLEIFKLPFLLNLTVDNCTFVPASSCVEFGSFTLRELVARHIVKNNLRVRRNLPVTTRDYLLGVQECSFCNGPFFEHYIEITDMHVFDSIQYPVHYRMCCRHYSRHEDRLRVLFEHNFSTVPTRLRLAQMPSITELFEPFCFNPMQQKSMEEGLASDDEAVPLITLARFHTPAFRSISVERLLDESVEDLNAIE